MANGQIATIKEEIKISVELRDQNQKITVALLPIWRYLVF